MLGSRVWTSPRLLLALVLLASGAFAACGSESSSGFADPSGSSSSSSGNSGVFGGDGGPGNGETPQIKALVFEPPAQTIIVDGTGAKTATFKLKATLLDGSVAFVTPEGLEFDRPDLASAANGVPVTMTATGEFGGTGKLHGIFAGVEALADLTVQVKQRELGDGVSNEIASALDAATAADPSVQSIRYPYDKTVFPLGLSAPLVMWNAPAANDVYRLRLEHASYTYDYYAVVPAKGQIRAPQLPWDRVTASNSGDPVKVTLSRYAVASQAAYRSASEEWTIAPANLRGAIYYWSASQIGGERKGHIARIRPGSGSTPEVMQSGFSEPCMGCHAVSADGSTMVASVDAAPTGNPATYPYTNGWYQFRGWASFNLPDGSVRKQTKMNGSNLALTPDGKYTVFGGRMQTNAQAAAVPEQWEPGSKYMTLADTATGTVIVDSGLDDVQLLNGTNGIGMPAFSPDGKKLAAVEHDSELRDNVLLRSVQIVIFGFDQQTLKFSPTPTRLPVGTYAWDKKGIGYPTFTPSSQFVAYHVGNESTGCFTDSGGNCDDGVAHKGELWYQQADGASQPVRLTKLTDPPANIDKGLSVEPTFNPIERGNYSWVVFTSMRDWGNELTGAAINGKRRLWVAAIDAQSGAADPSHPAFYLEGQEDAPNMRGFWTLAACIDTPKPGDSGGQCTAGFECCSGFCSGGKCVDVSKIACVSLGDTCGAAADCCGTPAVGCFNGKCTATVVK